MLLLPPVLSAPIDHRDFVLNPQHCNGHCLMGIQLRITTIGEAISILENHPWAEDIRVNASGNGFAVIRWNWTPQTANWIDQSQGGRITFYWDDEEPGSPDMQSRRVETVSFYTHFRMFTLQQWFGQPDTGNIRIRPEIIDGYAYSVSYHVPGSTLNLMAIMQCPMSLADYWQAKARVSFIMGHDSGDYIRPATLTEFC